MHGSVGFETHVRTPSGGGMAYRPSTRGTPTVETGDEATSASKGQDGPAQSGSAGGPEGVSARHTGSEEAKVSTPKQTEAELEEEIERLRQRLEAAKASRRESKASAERQTEKSEQHEKQPQASSPPPPMQYPHSPQGQHGEEYCSECADEEGEMPDLEAEENPTQGGEGNREA